MIVTMSVSGGISQSNSILKAARQIRETKLFITQSPTVIAIMLVSGGISRSASNLKKSLKMRETKFFNHSKSHRDRHYVSVP